jgi:hypothetical protein
VLVVVDVLDELAPEALHAAKLLPGIAQAKTGAKTSANDADRDQNRHGTIVIVMTSGISFNFVKLNEN